VLGELLDKVLVYRYRPLREAAGHDLAQLGVLRRVGVDVRRATMSSPAGSSNEMPRADENVPTSRLAATMSL
jgi:hypothetical protein